MAKKTKANVSLKNNKLIFAGIIVLVIAVFVGSLTFLQSVYETETYYVLNQEVPTRTQVTPEMLDARVTSVDTAPPTAIGVSEVQSGNVYTKHALMPGDILTASNVGPLDDISVGVPDSWVITNFSVNADNAVGGRIKRGYYFDMLITTSEGAFYPFVNVLTLDTSIDLSNASSNQAADTQEAKSGQTTQYVVGMSPQDAARLHDLLSTHSSGVKLLLSPRQNEYNQPQLASYAGLFRYDIVNDGVIWPGIGERGDITSNGFVDTARDAHARLPVEVDENGDPTGHPLDDARNVNRNLLICSDPELLPNINDSDDPRAPYLRHGNNGNYWFFGTTDCDTPWMGAGLPNIVIDEDNGGVMPDSSVLPDPTGTEIDSNPMPTPGPTVTPEGALPENDDNVNPDINNE